MLKLGQDPGSAAAGCLSLTPRAAACWRWALAKVRGEHLGFRFHQKAQRLCQRWSTNSRTVVRAPKLSSRLGQVTTTRQSRCQHCCCRNLADSA